MSVVEIALLLVACAGLAAATYYRSRQRREPPPSGNGEGSRFQELSRDIRDPRVKACFEQMARWSERLDRDTGERIRRIADAARDDAKRRVFDALERAARDQGDDDFARRLSDERRRLDGG